MIYHAQKLFNGCARVRTYMVAQCLARGEALTIIHRGATMTIPAGELQRRQTRTRQFTGEFTKQTHTLCDFTFISDAERNERKAQQGTPL